MPIQFVDKSDRSNGDAASKEIEKMEGFMAENGWSLDDADNILEMLRAEIMSRPVKKV
jgi:hypothetical protein